MQKINAAIVNVSGRQRMLSQRAAFFCLLLIQSGSAQSRNELRSQLQSIIDLIATSHHGLIYGDPALNLPGQPSEAVRILYFEPPLNLDQQVQTFLNHLRTLVAAPDEALQSQHPSLVAVTAAAVGDLLTALDVVVRQYERESDAEQRAIARVQAEVELTRQVQTMLLPKDAEIPDLGGLEIAGSMEPATQVGGDYYDIWTGDNSSINFGIGDVTGHGLASGMVMLMAQTAVRTLLLHGETDLMQLIGTVNRVLYDNTRRMGTYKQMTLALLLYEAGCLQLSGQHESLLIVRADGSLDEVDTLDLGFPLGLEPDIMPFMAQTKVDLEIGDVAVLYTDGITEAMNAENQQYGLDRFNQVLRQSRHLSAAGIHQAVVDNLKQHIGSQVVFDDITLLVLKQQVPPDFSRLIS